MTTFSILLSKLFVSLCIPPLHDDFQLPSICLYLVITAGVCQVLPPHAASLPPHLSHS